MSRQPAPEDIVRIFTDGACSGNPGPGGWAFIMEHPATGRRLEQAGAEPLTTNNRMEIISALRGLALLKRPCRVEIVTDSQYLAKGITEWLPGWRANGYKRREAGKLKPLSNEDLWRAVDEQVARHEIRVTHVKGHAGHPENERCDQMAVAAYKRLMAGSLPQSQAETWTDTLVKTAKTQVIYSQPAEPLPPKTSSYGGYATPPSPAAQQPAPPAPPAQLQPELAPAPQEGLILEPPTTATKAPKARRTKKVEAEPAPEVPAAESIEPPAPKRRTRAKAGEATPAATRKRKTVIERETPMRWDPDETA